MNWSCYLYLGVEYYRLASQNSGGLDGCARLFVSQNRYLDQLRVRLTKEGHKFARPRTARPKAFGADHQLDLETKKEEEVPLADTRELQGVDGRVIPISKTGWQYLYPIERSSSAPAFPSALERSKQLESCIASHYCVEAMAPEPSRGEAEGVRQVPRQGSQRFGLLRREGG